MFCSRNLVFVTSIYRNARNRVISLLRKAKSRYFHQLNPKDSKKFWKSVKYLNKKQSTIPTLQSDDVSYVTDQEKASKLNSFFHLVLIILTSHSLLILTEISISLIVKICIVLLKKCNIHFRALMSPRLVDLTKFLQEC